MAAAQRAVDDALRSVLDLRAAPERGRDAAEERAWELLRKALREARAQPWALAAPEAEAAEALRFLAAWAAKRRVLRAKVVECLQQLLACEAWLRAARAEAELLKALEALLPVPASAPPAPAAAAAAGAGPEPAPEAGAAQGELRGALELLAAGLQALRGFAWAFPPESSQDVRRDGAVNAFRSLFLGAARLSTAAHRAGAGPVERCRITAALEAHSADWPGVLRFLVSLHAVRRVFSSQISSLVAKLAELSPSFQAALAELEGELPGLGPPTRSAAPEGAGARAAAAAGAAQAPTAAPAQAQLSAQAQAERAVFVGSRVEALYEGEWYGGTVVAVPAEDEEGRWIVQCDGDEPGTLTYARSVSTGVEAFYEGHWYRGSVVSVPSEDPEGRWVVQCDSDPPGTVTYTTSVRLASAVEEAEPSGQDAASEAPASADGAATSPAAASSAAEVVGAEAASASDNTPASPTPSVLVEGMPLVPAPAAHETQGSRRNLGAFARLPGSATPPRSLTPPPTLALPAPRTPPSASPLSLHRSVEVVEVVPRAGAGASASAPAASPRGVRVAVEVLPPAPRPGSAAAPAAPAAPASPRGATPPRSPGASVRVPVAVVPPGAEARSGQRFQPAPRTLPVPVAVRLPG